MSKLSFRARALDPSKPLNIHVAEELPDLTEYSAINRAVPQMPSGMEKEEESEHHLQRAICAGLIIPTPEVFETDQEFFDKCYPDNYKLSRQLIRMQPLGIEQDIPDYDIDSADEAWINSQTRRLDLSPLQFEEMMDRLEKSSGQTVVTLNEAKALLKQDDEVSIAVYDYWLNKRLTTQHPLILSIKTEHRAGLAINNPYIAFRRRTEKMQTRKNRKNDEASYEKMLKLKRNLSRAVTILEMIKRREKTKREDLRLGIEIFEKRFQAKDFNGQLLSEFSNIAAKSTRPAFAPLYGNQYSHSQQQPNQNWPSSQYAGTANNSSAMNASLNKRGDVDSTASNSKNSQKEKRSYKKRKHKNQRDKPPYPNPGPAVESMLSSDEDEPANNHLGQEAEDEGLFQFRRSNACQYHRPLVHHPGNWPWASKEENGLADPRYRFTLTSIRHPRPRCIGFARRRLGRGGRIVLDRVSTSMDDIWSRMDYTIFDSDKSPNTNTQQNEQVNNKIVKVESDPSSVVIDLVTNNNNLNHLKSSIDSGDERTKTLNWSENIVIKTEQKPINDFDNSVEVNITRNNLSLSASASTLSSGTTDIVTPVLKTISQGIHINSVHSLSSTSVQQLNVTERGVNNCNSNQADVEFTDGISAPYAPASEELDSKLYAELFDDWLHFRPKTPDSNFDNQSLFDFGESTPQFAEDTSLSVEIQRLCGTDKLLTDPTSFLPSINDSTYLSTTFAYEDVANDKPPGTMDYLNYSSSVENLNLSADSLPEINLSLGENEENDKMLDNLLEECQFDELKGFNPSTNFWNGLLDDSGGLLDVIDERKQSISPDKDNVTELATSGTNPSEFKTKHARRRVFNRPIAIGSSAFNVINHNHTEDIFKKSERVELPVIERNVEQSCGTAIESIELDIKQENDSTMDTTEVIAIPEIKSEPVDESTTSTMEDPAAKVKPQSFPVIKTEVVNNIPVMTNTILQRPLTIQSNAQLQTQQTVDGTVLLSTTTRPIRRFTTNGPIENKPGIQQLIINRKIQMVPQRSIEDDKEMKPTYLKMSPFPAEFNVVSSNNISSLNASAITSKHNYSLPPQAAFHTQPITLIGQAPQMQNKVIVNSAPSHSGNITIATPIQDIQNKLSIPTSNIKLNIVPSIQMMQAGNIVIDPKTLAAATGDHKTTIISQPPALAQQQQPQTQSPHQKVKIEKTVNMMFDSDRNRILYTNIKNNRGGTQFLAQLNPKVVNILPIQHKNNMTATMQGIVTPTGIINKNIQRMVASPSTVQSQSIGNLRQTTNAGATIGGIVNANVSSSNTAVIIGTSTGQMAAGNTNLNINSSGANNMVSIPDNSLTKLNQNNSDNTAASAAGININTTNR